LFACCLCVFYILIYHSFWKISFCKTDFENEINFQNICSNIFPEYDFVFASVNMIFAYIAQKVFAGVYTTLTQGGSSCELDAAPSTKLFLLFILCHLGGFCWKAKEPPKVRYYVAYNEKCRSRSLF
jgi:hypothetical protein